MVDLSAVRKRWRQASLSASGSSPDVRVGLAGSFTLDPVLPYLGAALLDCGYAAPSLQEADYNQIPQVCLSGGRSFFGGTAPDVIVLVWRLEDLAPAVNAAALKSAATMIIGSIDSLCGAFAGTVIVGLPPRPKDSALGMTAFSRPSAALMTWHEAVGQAIEVLSAGDRVHFVDLDLIVSEIGVGAHDVRKRLLYRQPYTEQVYFNLGQAIARIIRARTFEAKKCIVLDCDNTLWKGVIGEDGVEGVQVGQDFPGSAFQEVQRQIRRLSESGVFIALNSKNNADDVWEVFDHHEGMILRRDDVSAAMINWNAKSENLKAIAAQLNIGLDALVFIDDSPFELAEVGANAPGVICVQVPEDPSEYPDVILACAPLFDRLVITADDLKRVSRMKSELRRQEAARSTTPEEFLASLELKVFVYPPEPTDLSRVTQLINKTNQFNCTTRRLSLDDVKRLHESDEHRLYCLSVADKFDDYGLVGVATLSRDGATWTFDDLLMSCRVLGRGVETSFIHQVGWNLAEEGAGELLGLHVPTPKNGLVTDLFERHGFDRVDEPARTAPEGASLWRAVLPLKVPPPSYVQVIAARAKELAGEHG